MKTKYDVVVAGAGPVGLFLACELALFKCSVLVLEKEEVSNSSLKKLPFGARGLSSLSVESLYRRGLLSEFELHKRLKNPHMNTPEQGPNRQLGHFAGIPLLERNIDMSEWKHRLPSSTEVSLLTEMDEIENILLRRAEALGVEIKRGFAITNFKEGKDSVNIQSNDKEFECQWLIGCDGARSIVRKLGGFEFAGTEPEFTGYSTKVDVLDPEKLKPGRNVTEKGMYLQSQPGFIIIQDFDGGAFHASGEMITKDHVQEVLRRISNTDVTINALHTATTWTDRARQATNYRKGRILLAGDAAHIHSPLGGQGLNLGLGDAINLGWKLAATVHDKAPSGLIDSYQNERHAIGAQVLDWSRAQVAIMSPDAKGRALNAIVRDLINTKDGATYMASRIWGIFTHYDLEGSQPLLGYSVPNFEFEDDKRIGEFMHEGHGILLDFENDSRLYAIANEYCDSVKYISKVGKVQLGFKALLIRPDGIIAWSTEGKANCDELKNALSKWFVMN